MEEIWVCVEVNSHIQSISSKKPSHTLSHHGRKYKGAEIMERCDLSEPVYM